MEQVFESVKEIEKQISGFLSDDENTAESIMIENAAKALEKAVLKACSKTKHRVTVLCGSGNNGADGYALCLRLSDSCKVNAVKVKEPKSFHCRLFYDNLVKSFETSSAAINFYDLCLMQGSTSVEKVISKSDVIVDCIFGTGFHGTVDSDIQKLFSCVNSSKAYRIACDIPSGVDSTGENISSLSFDDKKKYVFFADKTVTMGGYKIGLFSDAAKDCTGKIKTAEIGVSEKLFNETAQKIFLTDRIFLLKKSDVAKPIRREESVHKGKFGHVCVMAGDKVGAAILCASSSFKAGAGLVSLVLNDKCDFEHFKIPASIMTASLIPDGAVTFVAGPGFGRENDFSKVISDIKNAGSKNKAVVFDADSFYYKETVDFINENSTLENPYRIVITPHPKEFSNLLKLSGIGEYSVKEVCDKRLELVRKFCKKYKNITLVLKGANPFIACGDTVYICTYGSCALAKGGSGDVLAGVIAGLLAQKYEAKDAAINGVLMHALASRKIKENYSLTPELLIENL